MMCVLIGCCSLANVILENLHIENVILENLQVANPSGFQSLHESEKQVSIAFQWGNGCKVDNVQLQSEKHQLILISQVWQLGIHLSSTMHL